MERYYLSLPTDSEGYPFEVAEVHKHDPTLIPELTELDLLTFSEPTFSRFTLGAILRFGRVFTARADGLLIGACHCLRNWERPSEVVLFNMALRPGWRGRGLGTRFLHRLLAIVQAEGAGSVALVVGEANARAMAVYRDKFGFVDVETLENEYDNHQEYRLMRLDLTQPLRDPSAPRTNGKKRHNGDVN